MVGLLKAPSGLLPPLLLTSRKAQSTSGPPRPAPPRVSRGLSSPCPPGLLWARVPPPPGRSGGKRGAASGPARATGARLAGGPRPSPPPPRQAETELGGPSQPPGERWGGGGGQALPRLGGASALPVASRPTSQGPGGKRAALCTCSEAAFAGRRGAPAWLRGGEGRGLTWRSQLPAPPPPRLSVGPSGQSDSPPPPPPPNRRGATFPLWVVGWVAPPIAVANELALPVTATQ